MKRLVRIYNIILFIIAVGLSWLQTEGSLGFYHLAEMEPKYILVNLVTIGAVWSVLMLITNRTWLASLLLSLVSTGISVVNYYVIAYKGNPLTFMELKNFSAALNVASSYSFNLTFTVLSILMIFALVTALCIAGACLQRKYGKPSDVKRRLVVSAVILVGMFAGVYVSYLAPASVVPHNLGNWRWKDTYYKYGYAISTADSLRMMFDYLQEPEGYSEEVLESIDISVQQQGNTPDVILILNETFYDLGQITDLNADAPYLSNYENMEGLYTGYVVVPDAGGGTNRSEYELLSGNSVRLLPGITPFTTLDLSDANSIVSHMNRLGYDTLGAHSESGESYYRIRSYNALGFDHIYFDWQFPYKEPLKNRIYATDESLYRSLIEWNETVMDEAPRFSYLLTIQNHGEWEGNPPEADTIHAASDYGAYDEIVDEYLSCIQTTDEAFRKLTEYYSESDRPTIICMMGDHSPNFADEIADGGYSDEELELRLRRTPLLIWANYDLEIADYDLGMMSMNFVVPTLLDMAGVTLSPYYQYMLDLKQDVPVLTTYGIYYDADGNLHRYSDETEYTEAVNNYFYLEYYNLSESEPRKYFEPIA